MLILKIALLVTGMWVLGYMMGYAKGRYDEEKKRKDEDMIPDEMLKLRNILNARDIKWFDRTERPSFSLLDLTIWRTCFMYKGREWSVISGYGTYGGQEGLLEVMVDNYNPCGRMTAREVLMMMDGGESC